MNSIVSFFLIFIMVGCNQSSFNSFDGNSKKPPTNKETTGNSESNSSKDAGEKFDKNSDTDQGDTEKELCNKRSSTLGLDMIVLLDISTSMAPYIFTIRENLRAFSDAIGTKNIDVRIGIITFVDSIVEEQAITSDLEQVQFFLDNVTTLSLNNDGTPNMDMTEASQLALQSGLDMLADQSNSRLPTILSITDAVGHDGSGLPFSRNCDVESISNSITEENIFLYYSVSPNQQYESCSNFSTAASQYSEIASIANTDRDRAISLAWPFSEKSMLEDLPERLKKDFDDTCSD
jgi:hypothetical protein